VTANTKPSLTRPERLSLFLGAFAVVLALANVVRAGMALRYARLLPELAMTVSWSYLAAMGGVWGAAFLASGIGLLLRRRWGRFAALGAATLYQINVWVNHLFFDVSPDVRRRWPRDLIVTLLFLAIFWGILCLPGVRRLYSGQDELAEAGES